MNGPLTPARQQYLELKAQYPHALLWYRLGDFYEMFDDDARTAAAALRITLTSRQFGKDVRVPMCGVPHHAHARFLSRLLRQGFSVAICEQLSKPGKGIVDRQVVRVVTPGTVTEAELLKPAENNYLAAVTKHSGNYGLAWVDVSTGEFCSTEHEDQNTLIAELERVDPAECLLDPGVELPDIHCTHITRALPALWDLTAAAERLRRHLGTHAVHVSGCFGRPAMLAAAGAILSYLELTNRSLLGVIHRLRSYSADESVAVDPTTRTMLLGRTGGPDREKGLLHLLDATVTPMGARLLARRLRRPLQSCAILVERLDAVQELVEDAALRARIRAILAGLVDLERTAARIGQERASPEDLHSLALSLEILPEVVAALAAPRSGLLIAAAGDIDPAVDLAAAIRSAVGEPGGTRLIRDGHDPQIDLLAAEASRARQHLSSLEETERMRTGIRSLKVGFNQVSGYYVEITKPNLGRVPGDYMRKQTLAHAERFVTADLLHWESVVEEAESRLLERDRELFADLLRALTAQSDRLLATAAAIAEIDLAATLAEVAECNRFCRPDLTDDLQLTIVAGRHPLVEQALGPGAYIPNDCALGGEGPAFAVITGPNMGGKSTFLRQVALIVYLAQIGSYVPAERARIGLTDRIFARVGAHDDLAAGHSTFLLEMAETAAIARLATPRSLVLFDELGRGTTSADGYAIAFAVAEYLHQVVEARTLFATHYYDLAHAAESWPGARNLHVTAEEYEGAVVFLYRVEPGIADRSYAIQVARMAGMPEPIILRAEDLLRGSGAAADVRSGGPQLPRRLRFAEQQPDSAQPAIEALMEVDIAAITPLQALNKLFDLQQLARLSRVESAAERQEFLPRQ